MTSPPDGTDASDASGLPRPNADLFMTAGAIVARQGAEAGAPADLVRFALRRAAAQAAAVA